MLRTLGLILPALIPSWNFFDVIAPSPRIEFRHLNAAEDAQTIWQVFRPRPQHVSVLTMFRRMIWNPWWNETLYSMSLSERLIANPTEHSADGILNLLRQDILKAAPDAEGYIQFRLNFIYREGDGLENEVLYQSDITPIHSGRGVSV